MARPLLAAFPLPGSGSPAVVVATELACLGGRAARVIGEAEWAEIVAEA